MINIPISFLGYYKSWEVVKGFQVNSTCKCISTLESLNLDKF